MSAPSSRPVHPRLGQLDCSPFSSIMVTSNNCHGGAHGNNNGSHERVGNWSPFDPRNFVSPVSPRPYEPPDYACSLHEDWPIWSIDTRNDAEKKDSLTFRQPFPRAVSESLSRLKALYRAPGVGLHPLLHMCVTQGAIMLYWNPAIHALVRVRGAWDARPDEGGIGTPEDEFIRNYLDSPTPLKLTAPSSLQGGQKSLSINVRPEVRQAVNALTGWAGMQYGEIGLACATTYLGSQAVVPKTYREELRNSADKWVKSISFKARLADYSMALYHADMGVEWHPCDFTSLEYTPHLELLHTLRALYNPKAREDEAGGEIM